MVRESEVLQALARKLLGGHPGGSVKCGFMVLPLLTLLLLAVTDQPFHE
jgi:hypothetical protein